MTILSLLSAIIGLISGDKDALTIGSDIASSEFNGIYSQAGISNNSSHSGRRSEPTTLAYKGVSLRVLMALAGHSRIATTQRFIDLRPSVVKAAVELV